MRILYVTSEAHPLVKTGGLADVSGALPAALRGAGEDVQLLLPGYPQVLQKICTPHPVAELTDLPIVGTATLVAGTMPDTGVPVLAIACPGLYERDGGPYLDAQGREWADNALRFGILSRVGAGLAGANSPLAHWRPDIVHCNDWQSGLIPAFLHYGDSPAKTVLGIHNIAFQGNFPSHWVGPLGLPQAAYAINGLEYYGQMSFLKAGIVYADSIVTVSPTYAREIQSGELGFGMQGILSTRHSAIHGILNGIDTREWDPATDSYLTCHYDANNLAGKLSGKLGLQERLGLHKSSTAPLLGVVSRLTSQKGSDLLLECAGNLLHQGCQMVVLGGGEAWIEHEFNCLAMAHPGQVSVTIAYDEPLAHRIMAGADIFVMPSRFEPCGLNQMYGLAYGTPPVVRRTGGLADSVTDVTPASIQSGDATGFVFDTADAETLQRAIERAIDVLRHPAQWQTLQRNGMRQKLGWERSAQAYRKLYRNLLK